MRELKIIYRKNKHKLLPLVVGMLSFFVIYRIIIPQWDDIQDTLKSLESKQSIVRSKDATVNMLNSISQETIDDAYEIVITALPLQKDLILIFSELKEAADAAGVDLGSFSVKVGGVYAQSKSMGKESTSIIGIPYLNTNISIGGNSGGIRRFAENLYKSTPLIEINSVDISREDGRIDVNLFYRPIMQSIEGGEFKELEGLSSSESTLIQELKSWKTQLK